MSKSAVFRCLVHPSFKIQALLRAVLRDEMIAWHKKNAEAGGAGGGAGEAAASSSGAVASTGQQGEPGTRDGEQIIK